MRISKLLRVAAAAATLGLISPAAYAARDSQSLFRVERSKNANVVQYEVRLADDGRLDGDRPVVGYWVRHEDGGERRDLRWLERKLAYGFDARPDHSRTSVTLEMVAPIGRTLEVRRVADEWRAETRIDGRAAWLERVYVASDESGPVPRVLYMDLVGTDVRTGEPRVERLRPD